MRTWRLVLGVVVSIAMARADVPPVPAAPSLSARLFTLEDGSTVVGATIPWPWPGGAGEAQGLWKLRPGETPDPRFNGSGFVANTFWGSRETVNAVAQLPGDRILVLGTAVDPVALPTTFCRFISCGLHVTLTSLRLDGTLDTTFNRSGRAVFVMDPGYLLNTITVTEDRIILGEYGETLAILTFDGKLDPAQPSALIPAAFFDVGALWEASPGGASTLGLAISQGVNRLFVTVQSVDAGGTPRWWVVPDAVGFLFSGTAAYGGTVYETRGEYLGGFVAQRPSLRTVGDMRVWFSEFGRGHVDLTIDGQARSIPIVRRAGPPERCGWLDQEGWRGLWNLNGLSSLVGLSGSAVFVVQDFPSAQATWFTYDIAGRPTWYEAALDFNGENASYDGRIVRDGRAIGTLSLEVARRGAAQFVGSVRGFDDRASSGIGVLDKAESNLLVPARCR